MLEVPIERAALEVPIETATVSRDAGDSARAPAIPLAMSTMKNETLESHNFYAWFSS